MVTGQLKRSAQTGSLSARDMGRIAEIVVCVVAYVVLAETMGYLLTAGLLLVFLLLRLGNRWCLSFLVSMVVVAVTYQLFAVVLRVPLPRGWLGW